VGPIPEDLIVFLLFAAFVLVQILRSRRRGRRRSTRAEPVATGPADGETVAQAEPEPEPQPEPVAATPAQPAWTPTLIEGPRPRPPAAELPGQVPAGPPARRPSYRRLLRGRPALQDAIVVAAILGPCRAQRPREME
jgi:hypothetical protein